MTNDYKYLLMPYNGMRTRFECPQCHDRKSFVPYVCADSGAIVDLSCGRCNHQSSCGYHYKPSQYFKDNAWRGITPQQERRSTSIIKPIVRTDKPLDTLPYRYVERYLGQCLQTNFSRWLHGIFEDRQKVDKVLLDYCVGGLVDGSTVFWQIDKDYNCRCGKTIRYKTNGHRVKVGDPEMVGYNEVGWVHSRLKREGIISQDWTLSQCLFGEMLIQKDSRRIGIVEAEKSAIVMSIADDSFLWLACGGLDQFSERKMKCLEGREVVLFPDQGCHERWEKVRDKLSKYCKCKVSNVLRNDNDPQHKGWDIADLVVSRIQNPYLAYPEPLRTFCLENSAIGYLIETFDLEIA